MILHKIIAEYFTNNVIGLSEKLKSKLGKRQANTDRVVRNWAVLMTVYQLLNQFIRDKKADDIFPQWQDVMLETVQTLREERASEVFLDLLETTRSHQDRSSLTTTCDSPQNIHLECK
jgi:hypothetical protein